MTGDDLKSCNKGDSGINWNAYFSGQACKYNFCIIPSIILLIFCIKAERLKQFVTFLIRLSFSYMFI